jgi:hypothetical protein
MHVRKSLALHLQRVTIPQAGIRTQDEARQTDQADNRQVSHHNLLCAEYQYSKNLHLKTTTEQ